MLPAACAAHVVCIRAVVVAGEQNIQSIARCKVQVHPAASVSSAAWSCQSNCLCIPGLAVVEGETSTDTIRERPADHAFGGVVAVVARGCIDVAFELVRGFVGN